MECRSNAVMNNFVLIKCSDAQPALTLTVGTLKEQRIQSSFMQVTILNTFVPSNLFTKTHLLLIQMIRFINDASVNSSP